MEGILLLDKAAGITSFDLVRKLRKISNTKKIGHCGTLDPFATGLMVMLFGKYTKFASYLQGQNKRYVAKLYLGKATSTEDTEGEVTEEKECEPFSKEQIEAVLKTFLGKSKQLPPQFSAISINGQRAYALARKGEKVDIPLRDIEILEIELLSYSHPIIEFEVACSKGTYVRSLGRDIGKELDMPAHLVALRRISSGLFDIKNTKKMGELTPENLEENLRTGASSVLGLERIEVSDAEAQALSHGKKIAIMPPPKEDIPLIACCGEELIAIVKSIDGTLKVLRGI